MKAKEKRRLRWRKIPQSELSLSRINLITLFAPSNDPSLTVLCRISAEPIQQLIARERERSQKKITMTMAVMKLVAMAVERHPEFNSLVFGGSIYQLEDIAITVPHLLPGENRELTNLIIQNPQSKSLDQIYDDCEALMRSERTEDAAHSRLKARLLPAVFIKTKLYRLIGEKRCFRILYERGLATNLAVTNASDRGSMRFLVTKSTVHILRVFTRFYLHGVEEVPVVEDGSIVAKKLLPLSIAFDHRLIDGVHLNAFVKTLEELAATGLNTDNGQPDGS